MATEKQEIMSNVLMGQQKSDRNYCEVDFVCISCFWDHFCSPQEAANVSISFFFFYSGEHIFVQYLKRSNTEYVYMRSTSRSELVTTRKKNITLRITLVFFHVKGCNRDQWNAKVVFNTLCVSVSVSRLSPYPSL